MDKGNRHGKHTPPPISNAEEVRLKELYSLDVVDITKESRFDRYTTLLSELFNVPIAIISVIDANHQLFKSCVGSNLNEISRNISFCSFAIHEKEILVIPDATLDERFEKNPMVLGEPNIRFYAGAILKGPTGQPVGTVCIIDKKPRDLSEKEKNVLIHFARIIEPELCRNEFLNQMRDKLEKDFYFEQSTDIPNRRFFIESLMHAIKSQKHNQQIAVIAIRIYKFDALDTSFGSEAGSFVIQETASRLKKAIGESNILSRWEDDCFITYKLNSLAEPLNIGTLRALSNVFQKAFTFDNTKHHLHAHIGVSLCPLDSSDVNQLINKAIYAMRVQSTEDIFSYRFYSDEITKKVAKEYVLETLLAQAIENNKLEVYYQPKIDMLTRKICGVEALCRWNDPTLGPISPAVFIPLAEKSDLIIQLGQWMLKQACKQAKEWQQQGHTPSFAFPISVNISKKQLLKEKFSEDIQNILLEAQLDAAYLDLEITESVFIDFNDVLEIMNEIRKLGVSFSLDDFGTGYSSLSHLRRFPLKTLKIDKSFISDMTTNLDAATLVRTIIIISGMFNLITVAEGVETAEQLTFLRAYQCDQIQGYIFSNPLSVDDFNKLLLKNDFF